MRFINQLDCLLVTINDRDIMGIEWLNGEIKGINDLIGIMGMSRGILVILGGSELDNIVL